VCTILHGAKYRVRNLQGDEVEVDTDGHRLRFDALDRDTYIVTPR